MQKKKRKIFIISIFAVSFIFVISILLNFFVFSQEAKAQTSLPPDCDLKTFKSTDSDKPPFPSFCHRLERSGASWSCAENVIVASTHSCSRCESWKLGNETDNNPVGCNVFKQCRCGATDSHGIDPEARENQEKCEGVNIPQLCNTNYGTCLPTHSYKCATGVGYGAQFNCEVYTIQFYLNKAGYGPVTVDGVYGLQTCTAIQRFQEDKGLTVGMPDGSKKGCGVVSETTTKRLARDCLDKFSGEFCCKIFLQSTLENAPEPPEPPEPPETPTPSPSPPPVDTSCLGRCDVPLIPCSMTGDPPPKCNLCYLFKLIQNVICYLTWCIAGPLAVISLLIAGVLYLTARGDPGQIGLAKDIIQAAVIGLIIVFCAWIIVNTIITLLGVGGEYSNWWRIDCIIPSP